MKTALLLLALPLFTSCLTVKEQTQSFSSIGSQGLIPITTLLSSESKNLDDSNDKEIESSSKLSKVIERP